MSYFRPTALQDALVALGHGPQVLAGGTDIYPANAQAHGWGAPRLTHLRDRPILDVSGLLELNGLRSVGDSIEIGALVTWHDAIHCDLPTWFNCVRLAGQEVGGPQIQNRGTLVGNLCNASPAADGVPPLLVLDAKLRVQSARGSREIALNQFISGNRQTLLADDEMVTTIVIPRAPASAQSTFLKLGARRYLVISIAMVAAFVDVQDHLVVDCRIAVGACSEVAQRLPDLERRVIGAPLKQAAGLVSASDVAELTPLDDIRASAQYRRRAALELLRRALDELARRPGQANAA